MPYPPGVKIACNDVARRTAGFRAETQKIIAQLSNMDLDVVAHTYPPQVGTAMVAAETARLSLIRALAEFDARCGAVEGAAIAVVRS